MAQTQNYLRLIKITVVCTFDRLSMEVICNCVAQFTPIQLLELVSLSCLVEGPAYLLNDFVISRVKVILRLLLLVPS